VVEAAADEMLGASLAIGDFDGNGADDIAAGAPGADGAAGRIFVWPGSESGVVTPGVRYDAVDLDCGAVTAGAQFGAAVAAGDFDGDGFDDLAVASPEIAGASGQVCIVRGSDTGLVTDAGEVLVENSIAPFADPPDPFDRFGFALATGHFSVLDGRADLVAGVPFETLDGVNGVVGTAVVFSQSGLIGAELFDYAQAYRPLADVGLNEQYGRALATGVVDATATADWLVVGASAWSTAAGRVFVHRPVAGLGTGTAILDQSSDLPGETSETNDLFGAAVAMGDFDGDGKGDFAVGAPGEAPGSDPVFSGEVAIFPGTAAGPLPGAFHTQESFPIAGSVNEQNDQYGRALAAGDFDGDGRVELAVGAPGDAISGTTSGSTYVVPEPRGALGVALGALALLRGAWSRPRACNARIEPSCAQPS
jgi:hypothetical protein